MIRLKDSQALAHLERRMTDTFDVGYDEYIAGTAKHLVPTAYFNAAKKIAETSGILELVATWDAERRKSNAGKKPLLPFRALIVLYLLNAQMGFGVTYRELARTVAHRFSPELRATLDIRSDSDNADLWYSRISETSYRLIALMNPRPSPLRKILDAEAFAALIARMDAPSALKLAERNQNRLDEFCNLLVTASLHQLPKDVWDRYKGNIALDATKVHIRGPLNSASVVGKRANPDPLAGRYRREGNHEGGGAGTDISAYELETSVMIWNKPGANTEFPSLVSVITCHNPGRLIGHAAEHMRRQKALGFEHFMIVVDRAYNGQKITNFHLPAVHLGLNVVFDYKKDDLGIQSHYEDLILVDGSWYVSWMPQGLIDVTGEFLANETELDTARSVLYTAEHNAKKKIFTEAQTQAAAASEAEAAKVIAQNRDTLETLHTRLAMREPYRMIPHGLRDTDGYQRFTYPQLKKMLSHPRDAIQKKSLTIPPKLPVNESVASGKQSGRKTAEERAPGSHAKGHPVKFTQRFPYKSADWFAHYGMRSLVEGSNHLLKTKDHGDIETPKKRSGRGYAATYLALTYVVVASNLRRIVTFFRAEADRLELASHTHRTRRRTDDLGRPLPTASDDSPPITTK